MRFIVWLWVNSTSADLAYSTRSLMELNIMSIG